MVWSGIEAEPDGELLTLGDRAASIPSVAQRDDDFPSWDASVDVARVLARIAAVFRRTDAPPVGQGVLTVGPIQVDQDRHRVEVDGQAVALTPTEFRLLVAIIAAKGRVLNRNQLTDQALGTDAVVTDRQRFRAFQHQKSW